MYLMKAESPGPSVKKLVPKVKRTAIMLYMLYVALTLLELVLLLAGRMPLLDALTHYLRHRRYGRLRDQK